MRCLDKVHLLRLWDFDWICSTNTFFLTHFMLISSLCNTSNSLTTIIKSVPSLSRWFKVQHPPLIINVPHTKADGHSQAAACHSYPPSLTCTCTCVLYNTPVQEPLDMPGMCGDDPTIKRRSVIQSTWYFLIHKLKRVSITHLWLALLAVCVLKWDVSAGRRMEEFC